MRVAAGARQGNLLCALYRLEWAAEGAFSAIDAA
jgi:hypothetical protein